MEGDCPAWKRDAGMGRVGRWCLRSAARGSGGLAAEYLTFS